MLSVYEYYFSFSFNYLKSVKHDKSCFSFALQMAADFYSPDIFMTKYGATPSNLTRL